MGAGPCQGLERSHPGSPVEPLRHHVALGLQGSGLRPQIDRRGEGAHQGPQLGLLGPGQGQAPPHQGGKGRWSLLQLQPGPVFGGGGGFGGLRQDQPPDPFGMGPVEGRIGTPIERVVAGAVEGGAPGQGIGGVRHRPLEEFSPLGCSVQGRNPQGRSLQGLSLQGKALQEAHCKRQQRRGEQEPLPTPRQPSPQPALHEAPSGRSIRGSAWIRWGQCAAGAGSRQVWPSPGSRWAGFGSNWGSTSARWPRPPRRARQAPRPSQAPQAQPGGPSRAGGAARRMQAG